MQTLKVILYFVQVHLAADVIQKLYLLAEDLPSGDQCVICTQKHLIRNRVSHLVFLCRFDLAKERIEAKYNEIERTLLDDFRHAFVEGDRRKMKRLMGILANFRVSSYISRRFEMFSLSYTFSCFDAGLRNVH